MSFHFYWEVSWTHRQSVIMNAVRGTTALLIILCLTCDAIGQLVRVNNGLEVPIGRSVSVGQDDLVFEPVEDGEQCKVEVALNEPYYQKVGTLQPEVFDCEFLPETIKYTHSGIPLLDHDVIKLRVYKFTETDTVLQTVYINVNITQEPYGVVQPMGNLQVERFFGSSELIDMRVLDLAYDRHRNVSCMVHINVITSGFPKFGELTRGEGDEKERVRALTADCYDFMMGMIRYEHLVPPTPNIDYIPMTVTINDGLLLDGMSEEVYYLPVEIMEGFPNQNPVAAMMSMYVMEADQFILTTITPSVISGRDDETANEDLIFFISQPFGPDEGYIVNLDDHTHPIESFTQYDLARLNIAYKPPSISSPERRVFTAEFIVYDAYFAQSNPINLMVSVRSTETNAPRVSVNTGLTMLEGQSRIIRPTNLQLVDNDNLNFVRAKVVGGLRHGRLYINERPIIMFSAADINSNTLVYRHDDSDTLKDSLELRITDGRHSVRTTFPINILPKDDSAPYLINNVQFELKEGRTIRITRFMLVAADMDSSDDYIIFRITQPPQAGEVLKKFAEDTYGYPVTEFTQRDLFRGLIYYHHLGGEVFLDSFEFVLLDNQMPPNESPTQVVMVKITPVHDLPPERVPGSTHSLTVQETDIAHITKSHLHFSDDESVEERLRYTITTPPYIVETHSLTNAGRVISTADVLSLSKRPDLPAIRSFTQGEINTMNIAYMPPLKEIGPNPVNIRFVFSVSDPFGNNVLGETFDITILPVNNQEPVLRLGDLTVREGQTLTFDPVKFSVTDMDTDAEELVITIEEVPVHGRVLLGGVNLTAGNSFTMADVAAGRVSYMSDGSESTRDEFTVSLSDGVHSVIETIAINVMPVNDEIPALLPGLNSELTITEGGSVTIGPDILSATDPDTNDLLLHYVVVMHPLRGVLLRDGVIVNRFSQRDVNRGRIVYEHTGGETGLTNIQEVITFIVSDKSVPSNPDLPVKDVIINITPSDNRPPRIVFGNPFFVDEGDRAPLTMDVLSAVDRDSPASELRFVITRQPVWGFLENILPSPGFEKSNAGKPITSFTLKDIADFNINFVQSVSDNMEPISDSFLLYVTDGEHSSPNVTFIVNITPQNDEAPTLTVRNFTVHEGSFFKIRTDTINANDLDIPMDMLMFSISRAPEHGMIINRVPSLVETPTPIYDFNLNQLHNTLSLAYVHDGSESTQDKFAIRVKDGKHTVRKTINITIIPINDESPEIIKNAGIRISIRESRILSAVILRIEDRDTPDDQLVYTLNSLPRRGSLQRKVAEDTWEDITQILTNFTQWDLNQNLIRYVHLANLGSKGIDRFYFSVSDGVHSTGKQNFRIMIQNTKREPLIITNNGLQLDEGETVTISPSLLSANDNSGQLTDIRFTVLSSPTQGHLEDVARPGIPLTTFSQMAILGRRLIYIHLRTDQVQNDHFTFSVTNGYELRNDTFQIVVNPVDNMLPVLMVKEDLTVAQDGFQIISLSQLHALDPDTPASSISFVITQPPHFGTLLIGGLPVEQSFTQQDVDNYDISYRHDFGQAETDEFSFIIEDGTNRGFLTGDNREIRYEPVRFQININIVDSSPPDLITNIGPTKMQTMIGRTGFVFSSMNLQAVDDCSADDVTYSVMKDPMFGHLEFVDTFQRVQGRFVQADINSKRVMYVMRENARAANDSFMFDVWDCHGNGLKNQRFTMHWSVVMFARPQYMVCESEGTISIPIIRIGNQRLSSFVSLDLHDMKATSGLDYHPSRARLLQFDPLVTTVTWDVGLVEDDLEETRERFRLTLADPVNAVIGEYNRLTVVIKDAKNGVCKNGPTDSRPVGEIPGCCVDQPGIVEHEIVPVPGIPPSDPYPYPDAGPGGQAGPGPGPYIPDEGPAPGQGYGPETFIPGEGPGLYNPGAGPQDGLPVGSRPDPYSPGLVGPVFNEGSLVDSDPAINDGPPIHVPYPGAPRIEHQPLDPYAEETWYRYPFGVGYDGTDGTRHGGPPYAEQHAFVESLPDQNCCDEGPMSSGTARQGPNPNINPEGSQYPVGNPVSNLNPYPPHGNPNPYPPQDNPNPYPPQGNPNTYPPQSQPPSHGQPPPGHPASSPTGTHFEQPFAPQDPGAYPPPEVVSPDQPSHASDGDVRLFHATVGGGESMVVPIVLADNRPGELDQDRSPQTELTNVFLPTVVRGVQEPRLTPVAPSSSGSRFPLGQANSGGSAGNHQPPPGAQTAMPYPCTTSNVGEIRQDPNSGSLAKCNGLYWVEFDISQLQLVRVDTPYDNGQCERGWSYHNSRCFLVSSHAQSWNEAQRICRERYNGNLASILSKQELKWLGTLLNGEQAWIGLNDKQVEDQWEWVSGDPITFTRWGPTSRQSNRRDRYDCTYITSRLRWMDRDCDLTTKNYICMKNAL